MRTAQSLADAIDSLSITVGKAGSLVLPILILTILFNVVLRYVFNIGMVELEELQWHLNAIVVMSCLAYTYQSNEHIRVDVLHSRFNQCKKAWVEILGIIFLFFPYTTLVAWHAWGIASYSWVLQEGSPMPSGLPARYLIKGLMAFCLSLLTLQGVAILIKNISIVLKYSTTTTQTTPTRDLSNE